MTIIFSSLWDFGEFAVLASDPAVSGAYRFSFFVVHHCRAALAGGSSIVAPRRICEPRGFVFKSLRKKHILEEIFDIMLLQIRLALRRESFCGNGRGPEYDFFKKHFCLSGPDTGFRFQWSRRAGTMLSQREIDCWHERGAAFRHKKCRWHLERD